MSLAKSIIRTINKYGQSVTILSRQNDGYDPITDENISTNHEQSVKALLALKEENTQEAISDYVYLLSIAYKSLDYEPTTKDKVILNQEQYSIKAVKAIQLFDQPLYWEIKI